MTAQRLVLAVATAALLAETSPASAQGATSVGTAPSLGSVSAVEIKPASGGITAQLRQSRWFETERSHPVARGGALGAVPESSRRMKSRQSQVAPESTANRSWRQRHPALFGALVGAGAGLAFGGLLVAAGQNNEPGLSHLAFAAPYALPGAGVGALLGYALR
jgi:hypothetical protein